MLDVPETQAAYFLRRLGSIQTEINLVSECFEMLDIGRNSYKYPRWRSFFFFFFVKWLIWTFFVYSAGQRFRYTYYDESQGEIYRSIEHLDKMVNQCPFLLVTHLMSDIWGLQCKWPILQCANPIGGSRKKRWGIFLQATELLLWLLWRGSRWFKDWL